MPALSQSPGAPGGITAIARTRHGSVHSYNQGCHCTLCKAAATLKKGKLRTRRWNERMLIDGVMQHPHLAPVDSHRKARHGTVYARKEFSCECDHCMAAGRRTLATCFGLCAGPAGTGHVPLSVMAILVASPLLLLFIARARATGSTIAAAAALLSFAVGLLYVAAATVARAECGRHAFRGLSL